MGKKIRHAKEGSTAKIVAELMDSRPYIKDLFAIGAVNYSGLARYLMPAIKERTGKKPNIEAVVMALVRYGKRMKKESVSEQILNNVSKLSITLKNDLTEINLRQTPNTYRTAGNAYNGIDQTAGETIHIFQSIGEISVLLDSKNGGLIRGKVAEDDILNVEENLAMVILNTPVEMVQISGVFYYLCGLIAREDIPLVDMVSTLTKLIFVVKEKDASKTYDVVYTAIRKSKEMTGKKK